LTPVFAKLSISPESSDGFASVGTILPKEEVTLLPGGLFAFSDAFWTRFEGGYEGCRPKRKQLARERRQTIMHRAMLPMCGLYGRLRRLFSRGVAMSHALVQIAIGLLSLVLLLSPIVLANRTGVDEPDQDQRKRL
jgi:hypothetical protein